MTRTPEGPTDYASKHTAIFEEIGRHLGIELEGLESHMPLGEGLERVLRNLLRIEAALHRGNFT